MAHATPSNPENHPLAPAALREHDAACYVGRSRSYLKKSRLFGTGPAFVRVQRSITYRVADLDAWLARHVIGTRERA